MALADGRRRRELFLLTLAQRIVHRQQARGRHRRMLQRLPARVLDLDSWLEYSRRAAIVPIVVRALDRLKLAQKLQLLRRMRYSTLHLRCPARHLPLPRAQRAEGRGRLHL